jgi:polyferredoxin
VRKTTQLFFLLFFTYLFFRAAYPLSSWIPVDLFLRADPLLALATTFSSREVVLKALPALILVVLTVLFGRFFCGYICPLGTLLDLSNSLIHTRKPRFIEGLRKFKFYLLIAVLVASIAGVNLIYFFDPLIILTRTYTIVFYPLAIFITNLSLDGIRPLADYMGWIELTYLYYFQPFFYMGIITGIIFAGIVVLNLISPRFWCRYICPLGALLGVCSRFGIFKRVVNDRCTSCMKCKEMCPMGAINDEPQKVQGNECLQCRTCRLICPKDAISFKPVYSPFHEDVNTKLGVTRRGFLYSLSGGLASGFFFFNHPLRRTRKDTLIRPPGAIPEEQFLNSCIRCSECMKVCITSTLQPSLLEGGPEGLWTPRACLRYAACEQTCNLCGKVCPTQAIRDLDLEEKKHARIGTAVILKEKCLVWEQDKVCLICDEQCPYNAIVFKTIDGQRRPFIIENKCNGCGLCEHKCPIEGEAAIVVKPLGEMRLKEGSYIEEARRLELTLKEEEGYDRFLFENEQADEYPP